MISLVINAQAAFEGFFDKPSDFLLHGGGFSGKHRVGFARIEKYGLPELALSRMELFIPGEELNLAMVFQASGDDVYREQRLSGECGLRLRNACFFVIADVYRVDLKGYGSALAPGLGFKLDWLILPGVSASGGIDGLLTGAIRDGHRDIDRNCWGSVRVNAAPATETSLAIDVPRRGRAGLTLAMQQEFRRTVGCRLILCDNPYRIGGGVYFILNPVTVSLSAVNLYPLGWSQHAGLSFSW